MQSSFTSLVIRASAGTGKTFQLSNRFLSLLHKGAPADQILATTFTRKAAGEILDRVMLRLADAVLDDSEREALGRHLDVPALTHDQCLAALQQLTGSLHRLRICTLDSFFAQVAGSFSLELGLPPGWRIVEPLQDARLRSEAIESVLREQSGDVMRLMNLMTKGDAERSVSELVRSTVDSLYSLYQETDREAWERFPQLRPLSAGPLEEALAGLEQAPLPSDKRFEKARAKDVERVRLGLWEDFVYSGLAGKVAAGETAYYAKPIPPATLDIYQQLVEHARATLIQQLARQTKATYELLDRFHTVYQQLKMRYRALTFNDVTRRLADAQQHLGIDHVDFRLDAPLSHLLLDEFQDTSLAQWQALRPFAERVTRTGGQQQFLWLGGQTSFFCVGDGKQAIYGWRGGRSEIFDALEAHLDGLAHEELTCSFRSAVPVIETVNQIFSQLGQHTNLESAEAGVQGWMQQFHAHTTAREELAGYTCLEMAPQSDDDEERPDEVAWRYAAQRIAELHREAPEKTIGVLVRKNRTVARMIYELRRLGVKASEEGGNPLIDSAAVTLVLSVLRLADHPADKASRFHVSQSPLAEPLGMRDHDDSVAAHEISSRIRRQLLDEGYGATVQGLAQTLAPVCNSRDQRRLEQLVERAFAYQPTATLRPGDFVRQVESDRVADPSPAKIRVMTIHQSKGLQFDAVFLPDLDANLTGQTPPYVVGQSSPTERIDRVCLYRSQAIQALLPADLQKLFEQARRQEIAESLCVLYVAVTRAVQGLYMILSPRTKEGKLPRTAAGLVRAALIESRLPEPGTVAFEHGDANWYRGAASLEPAADEASAAGESSGSSATDDDSESAFDDVEPVRLASSGSGTRPLRLERAAPSTLEGGPAIRLDRVLQLENVAGRSRGTIVHHWFEQIGWIEDGRPDRAELRRIMEALPHKDLDPDEMLEQFESYLADPGVAAVLHRSYYDPESFPMASEQEGSNKPSGTSRRRLDVQNERRFAIRRDRKLISGAIDRLVLIYEQDMLVAADIVDYKTDRVAPGNGEGIAELVEFYRPQQDAYRQAVAQMFKLPPQRVTARLVLLHAGVVLPLDAPPQTVRSLNYSSSETSEVVREGRPQRAIRLDPPADIPTPRETRTEPNRVAATEPRGDASERSGTAGSAARPGERSS